MTLDTLAGAHTALVTPFLTDGSVDWDGYRRNLVFQVAQGITGLLPCGTTGESPTLTWDEHNELIAHAVHAARGQAIVVAGTGSNSTKEALTASRHAERIGADALLLVECYYNGPSSLELRTQYHSKIAEACPDCAVIPYIIPGRTGTAMSAEDLAILAAEHPNVRAVKEATGDLDRMALTRSLCGDSFAILSGDDPLTCAMMLDDRIRADGVVSVMSNVAPAAIAKLVSASRSGNVHEAREVDAALKPLFDIVTVAVANDRTMPDGSLRPVKDRFRNPLAVKTLMNALGLPAGPARPPIGAMTPKGVAVVRDAVRTVWQNSAWVLEPIGEAYGVDLAARIEDDANWSRLARS
jgi:4-hydroxy-tetrahydrodipicolinate synthase